MLQNLFPSWSKVLGLGLGLRGLPVQLHLGESPPSCWTPPGMGTYLILYPSHFLHVKEHLLGLVFTRHSSANAIVSCPKSGNAYMLRKF